MHTAANACTTAAFFMEGMQDPKTQYDEAIEAYGQGCVEMVAEMSEYALLSEAMLENASGRSVSFPGVYDYEVSTTFGDWFAKYLIEHRSTPTKAAAAQKLYEIFVEFFTQSGRFDEPQLAAAARQTMEAWVAAATQ